MHAEEETGRPRFKLHWHVVLTHFPVSAYAGAFLFMALHIVTGNRCMEAASQVTVLASLAVLLPTTLSGWLTWKRNYKGYLNRTFRVKITTSVVLLAINTALVVYQTADPGGALAEGDAMAHAIYFVGVGLLSLGSAVEGYFGGRLHHP